MIDLIDSLAYFICNFRGNNRVYEFYGSVLEGNGIFEGKVKKA